MIVLSAVLLISEPLTGVEHPIDFSCFFQHIDLWIIAVERQEKRMEKEKNYGFSIFRREEPASKDQHAHGL